MERGDTPAVFAERTARKILIILVSDFGLRAGELLPVENVSSGWHQCHRRSEDFDVGLRYAIGHGWIEASSDGTAIKLTEAGFTAA